jgi:tetratricopeptide (TPR) repeat protein
MGGISLLGRASDLLPKGDPERVRLLPVLAGDLQEGAQLDRAADVLAEAIELAVNEGDPVAELQARLNLSFQRLATDPSVRFEELLQEAAEILDRAEELRDPQILIEAQRTVGMLEFWVGRSAAAEESAERAIARAREAGIPTGQSLELHRVLLTATVWGQTPVERGLKRWREILPHSSGLLEAWALGAIAALHAMRGEFEEARDLADRGGRKLLELGQTLHYWAGHLIAFIEDLAGNPKAVEQRMSKSIEVLRAAGETGFLSTSAVWLADALWAQERYEEALDASRLSEEMAARDDIASQGGWRSVRAKVYAKQGRLEDAERLAREAVAILDRTDHLGQIGDVHLALAMVLREAGKRSEAVAEARTAEQAFERKGIVVSAGKAQRFLEELASQG